MSFKRIKELQDYANDFNKKLELSEKSNPSEDDKCIYSYKNKIIKKSFSTIAPKSKAHSFNYRKSLSDFGLINSEKKLKPIVKRNENKLNIDNTLMPWIPPNYVGNYFGEFKRLSDKYDMSNWEKVFKLIL